MKLYVAHIIFGGCPTEWLNDPDALRAVLMGAITAGGFTLKETVIVQFEPRGVTGCAVVGESHLALHTWPEEGRLYFEVVSCSTEQSVTAAILSVKDALPDGHVVLLDRRPLDPDTADEA